MSNFKEFFPYARQSSVTKRGESSITTKYYYGYCIEFFKDLSCDYKKIVQQLDILLHRLLQADEFSTAYPVPSTAINCRYFDKDRYWRGPTWPITNYFIIEGLKQYRTRQKNVDQQGNLLSARTIQMIRDNGFWEYFDPIDDGTKANEKGIGFSSFSWTAAILIQLINAKHLTA